MYQLLYRDGRWKGAGGKGRGGGGSSPKSDVSIQEGPDRRPTQSHGNNETTLLFLSYIGRYVLTDSVSSDPEAARVVALGGRTRAASGKNRNL